MFGYCIKIMSCHLEMHGFYPLYDNTDGIDIKTLTPGDHVLYCNNGNIQDGYKFENYNKNRRMVQLRNIKNENNIVNISISHCCVNHKEHFPELDIDGGGGKKSRKSRRKRLTKRATRRHKNHKRRATRRRR